MKVSSRRMLFEERFEGGKGTSQQIFGARASQAESTNSRAQGGAAQAYVSNSKITVAGAGSKGDGFREARIFINSGCLGTPYHIIAGSNPLSAPPLFSKITVLQCI